jgi:hypothetical protein
MKQNTKAFILASNEIFGESATLSRDEIQRVVDEKNVPFPFWLIQRQQYRAGRGQYRVPTIFGAMHKDKPLPAMMPINNGGVVPSNTTMTDMSPAMVATVTVLKQKKLQDDADTAIPERYENYVPFGFYKDLMHIVKSKQFYPVFITGLSGNGKTMMVEQVCAALQRECIRVNISIETDESDLIGSNTLVDGNIVYRDGPVMTAMKRGAVLLIDEVDRGSEKLLCLQGILEGKAYFNKKSGEYIKPTPGFQIIATANTKGRGSEEGRFLAKILDDAFLERFPITVEQEYPSASVETKILKPLMNDDEFAENLIKWADVIRKTFAEGGVDEIISTRRLVHIAHAYAIFGDRTKAIKMCVNRFDEETKNSFLDLYTKVDAKIVESTESIQDSITGNTETVNGPTNP